MFSRRASWAIGAIGILILSPDALLLRFVSGDTEAIIILRALFSAATVAVCIAFFPFLRQNFRWKPVLLYGAWYALGLLFFPLSILNTHVANTLVIISAAPILAAIGAFFFLKERTRPATCFAALLIFVSMAGIFGTGTGGTSGLPRGNIGDLYALLVAVALAATSITVRRYPETAVHAGLIAGGLMVSLACGWFAEWSDIDWRDILILAADGALVMTFSFLLLITAARGITPAEFNLLFLLETLLAPFWVWLVLQELPPATTVASGVIIASVLVLHTLWLAFNPSPPAPPRSPHLPAQNSPPRAGGQ